MTTFETNALEINDLNKNYPGFSLNHLNLTLPSGCILGLIGENGAGKTTTIKLILDIIKKDSGSIRILGRDCTSATTILKEEIGVVFTTNISKNLTFQIKKNLVSFQKE